MSTRHLTVLGVAFEALAGRNAGAASADELLDAIAARVPDVSMTDFLMAADYLKRLSSRLKGCAWRLDPANANSATPVNARVGTGTRARGQ
jgi:hypothetical protein